MDLLYQPDCKDANDVLYGVGATLDSAGNVIDPGRVNNTLVVELREWMSIRLTTLVFSILAAELVRYRVCMHRLSGSAESC